MLLLVLAPVSNLTALETTCPALPTVFCNVTLAVASMADHIGNGATLSSRCNATTGWAHSSSLVNTLAHASRSLMATVFDFQGLLQLNWNGIRETCEESQLREPLQSSSLEPGQLIYCLPGFCYFTILSFFTYSSYLILLFSFDFFKFLTTSSDFTLKRIWILLMTLFSKVSDPAKQKSSTCVAIMPWSLFSKYLVKIAWSYFEGVAPSFISFSLSARIERHQLDHTHI